MRTLQIAALLALAMATACGRAPDPTLLQGTGFEGKSGLPALAGGVGDGTLPLDVSESPDGLEPQDLPAPWDLFDPEDTIQGQDSIPGIDTILGVDTIPGQDTSPDITMDLTSDIPPPPDCPVAVITVEEGDEVVPQTLVHLTAENSYSPIGQIVQWAWEVTSHPVGCPVFLQPSAGVKSPTVELNCAGNYEFRLRVWDNLGQKSCNVGVGKVVVIPCCGGFHIELLWDTPNDPDPTDEGADAGSDLDLHLLHPYASGWDADGDGIPDGWFDHPWDCYWFNTNPEWGSIDPDADDNPSLDRDDTDTLGPENINLNDPEPETYRVGVHYWDDHGYGDSWATVRVYFMGNMIFEMAGINLADKDLWEVCTVNGATGQVTPILDAAGEPFIRPDFNHPDFF